MLLESALTPVSRVAGAYASIANAINIGALKKVGLLKEGSLVFEETLGSPEENNHRLDNGKAVPYLFRIRAVGDLMGLLDPTNEEQFLTWEIGENSYVTLPGVAESSTIYRGTVKIIPFEKIKYSFEFSGYDGTSYSYRGEKDIGDMHLLGGFATVKGVVRNDETGEILLESKVFSGTKGGIGSILSVLKSCCFI